MTILYLHHAFLYISLPSLHDYESWKCLISQRKYTSDNEISPLFLNLDMVLWIGRVRLHLTNLATEKKANSLFQRRFVCRRRPRTVRSLITWWRRVFFLNYVIRKYFLVSDWLKSGPRLILHTQLALPKVGGRLRYLENYLNSTWYCQKKGQ